MRPALVVVICCLLLVGCGQSYEQAFQLYKAEITALEQLEKEHANLVTQQESLHEDSTNLLMKSARVEVIEGNDEKALQLKEAGMDLGLKEATVIADIVVVNLKIKEQKKRIKDAKAICDRLR